MPLASPSPWMPELCRLPRLAAMLGLAELVVVVLALAPDGSRHWTVGELLSASGFAVWLALAVTASLCLLRQALSRLPQVMGAVAARVEAVLTTLHRSLEDPAASNIDTINKGLASLLLERDLIAKSPTWPWTPGTLRAFASSVILPIVLFLLTLILERWIGP